MGAATAEVPGTARRFAVTALKACVSVGVLVWVFSAVNMAALVDRLGALDPLLGVTAIAVHTAQIPVAAWRWRVILAADAVDLPFRRVLSFLLVGLLFNQLLPSTVGGDGIRVWLLARTGTGWSRAFAAVAVDRAAAIFTALILTALLLPALAPMVPDGAAWTGLVTTVTLGAACSAMVLIAEPWAGERLAARLPDRRFLLPVLAAARLSPVLWRDGRRTLAVSLCSILVHGSNGLTVWLFAAAIGVTIDPVPVIALVLPVMVLLALPISIAGWGVREGLMVTGLGFLGVAPTEAVTVSLLWGCVTLIGSGLGGVALWTSRISRREAAEAPSTILAAGSETERPQ